MRKAYMSREVRNMAVLAMTVLALASCIKDDEVETAPECAILSFSVGSIKSYVTTKKYDSEGNWTDTIVQRTLTGSDVYFNIDQVNGRIYNVDSLPNWVDLTRVVPSFTYYGTVFGKVVEGDETYYRLTSGSDSIDFSKPVELVCVSTDGQSSKYYTVSINKYVEATDTLEWKRVESDLAIAGQNKAFCVGDSVYLFAEQADGQQVATVASNNDAAAWTPPVAVPVEAASVVLFGGTFYGRGTDGYLYGYTPGQLSNAAWTKASEQPVERLLAADAYNLYAYDGNAIIGSADLSTWTVQGTTDLDFLPETAVNSVAYASRTNGNLQQVVLTGLSAQESDHNVVWYRIASADGTADQPWAYIKVNADNPYGLPHLTDLSMTYYEGAIYAIGAAAGKYEYLYRSDDNGITWHPQTEKYPIPAGLDAANGAASIVAVDGALWMIQANGTIWQGSIR